jgi:hypothetical protein
MQTIDNLFALPAPLALLKTLMRPPGSLFFPILSSVLIQALVFVSILAPSALTVAPSEQVSREIEVPIFNLTSQAQFATGVFRIGEYNLTAMGEQTINSVLLNLPELTWAIPQDCGFKCAFYLEYTAPALECRDVIPDRSQDPPGLEAGYTVYQENSSLYPQNMTASPYDLSINYTSITNAFFPNITFSPTAGTYCHFYKATYNASFELNGNSTSQRASTSIISHGDHLSWGNATAFSIDGPREKWASWAICYVFALAFRGGTLLNIRHWLYCPNQPGAPIHFQNGCFD